MKNYIARIVNGSALSGMALMGVSAFGFSATVSVSDANAQATVAVANNRCPPGYNRGHSLNSNRSQRDANTCYESSPGAGARAAAAAQRSANTSLTDISSAGPRKTNVLDRCPIAYFTNQSDPMTCVTQARNAPTVRAKGSAPCPAGSVEDWGIWCVSNYSNLTRTEATTVSRDWNAIYLASYRATGSQQEPRQPHLPGASSYSPAYITIFGRVKEDGSPMDAAAAAAPAATPVSTRPSRTSGTLTPQRRTDASFLCPQGWVGGLPGTSKPDEAMCYPDAGATAAFPRQSEAETCPAGYVLSSTWCAQGSTGMPGQAQAQTAAAPNCPAPTSGAAQQAGAALGGLLGGRRGNSQAGSALGGLLGGLAAGTAKPAGCP
jgi:hypothetical protein